MIVEIVKEDKRLNLKVGERYLGEAYPLDPGCKVTLLKKISKKHKVFKKAFYPCNEYRTNLKIIEAGYHIENSNGFIEKK